MAAMSPPEMIVNDIHQDHASDSEDDNDSGEEDSESSLQIGFAEPVDDELMFADANWKEWDGGRIGGKPFWLNPKNLPAPKEMECDHCKEPVSFILQIYCPLDDVSGAFHRMLYLFCCRNPGCMNKGSIKTLRCQLPRINPFFAEHASEGAIRDSTTDKSLCAVCGFSGPLTCSACKKETYCSKSHQRLGWKAHKGECKQFVNQEGSNHNSRKTNSVHHKYSCVFPEFEIEVYGADEINELDEEKALALVKKEQIHRQEAEETLARLQQASGDLESQDTVEEMTEMAKMRQKDIIGREGVASEAMRDQTTFNFMLAVAAAKDQVLRYDRWTEKGGPLWIKSTDTKTADSVPPCACCGAPRKFEFQVMPQLVHFLGVDAGIAAEVANSSAGALTQEEVQLERLKLISKETLDWGVLAVYTCTKSCDAAEGTSSHYIEEFVYRQPPL